jgi:hypothetical protein
MGHSLLPVHSLAVGGKECVVVLDLIRSIMDQCVRRTCIDIAYVHNGVRTGDFQHKRSDSRFKIQDLGSFHVFF